MRWVAYTSGGADRLGLLTGEVVRGVSGYTSVDQILGDQVLMESVAESAMHSPFEVVDLKDVQLRSPLVPRSLRDFLAFLQHLRNARGPAVELAPEWQQFPAFYFSNSLAIFGASDEVPIFPGTSMFDFELEVAAVVGGECRNVDPEDADQFIAGYTIMCDWSARDIQKASARQNLGPAKGKDGGTSLGPVFVTSDELEPYRQGTSYNLEMQVSVNGERVGGGRMDEMDWSFGDLLSYASRGVTLYPGEVLGSGTVATGCLLEHYAMAVDGAAFRGWLQAGDVVRLEVEQLGVLEQRIVMGDEVVPLAPREDQVPRAVG